MMKRSVKIGAGLAGGVAAAVLLVPLSACACLTPEMLFDEAFKVNPIQAGAVATRAAMLKVVPPGSSAADARAAYALLYSGSDGARLSCAETPDTIRCNYSLSQSAFGIVRRGVRFAFRLDSHGLVADVTTGLTTHLFGREL